MNIGERIKLFRQSIKPKMTQAAFGEKLGMSRDAINNLENGRVDPAEPTLRLICQTYNINYAWLKTGEGDMEPIPIEDDTPGLLMARYRKGSPAVRSLLRTFASLDDDWYQKLDDAIRRAQEEYDEEENGSSE